MGPRVRHTLALTLASFACHPAPTWSPEPDPHPQDVSPRSGRTLTLSGVITMVGGPVLPSSVVELCSGRVDEKDGCPRDELVGEVRTGEDGRFAFEGVADGEYELFVRIPNDTMCMESTHREEVITAEVCDGPNGSDCWLSVDACFHIPPCVPPH